MPRRDRLLAVLTAALWGGNFLAIHVMLIHFPPLFAGCLRFLLIAVPTILLVPRPKVRPLWLIGYGLGFGTLQFAFLFVSLDIGLSRGLASLVLQASAPFTVLLGAVLLREKLNGKQIAGIVFAVLGMATIAWQQAEHAALLPVILTLLGALSWAMGNLCARKAEAPNPLHFTLWSTVIPPIPMFALSLGFEGPHQQWRAVSAVLTGEAWGALVGLGYISVLGTAVGASIWSTLMRRNPASTVAPFALLVPVVGLTLAFVVLGERLTPVEIAACVVVVGGVLLGSLPHRSRRAGRAGRSGRGRDQAETAVSTDSERGDTRPARMSSA